MQLTLTDEQRLLESSALAFLAGEYDFHQRAAGLADPQGGRPEVWPHFAEMGWLGLPLPEAAGGFGGGSLELGLLMRAFGRHLVVEPYLPCALAARLVSALAGHGADAAALLERTISGAARVALAHDEFGVHDPFAVRGVRAIRDAGGWRLHGRKLLALGAPGAERLLVTATDELGATGVFLLRPDVAGLHLHACGVADGGRAADVQLDGVRVDAGARLGGADATRVLHRVLAEGMVALCWEASGTMQAAIEQTADYTRQRVQFGRSISTFQVVQHRLAEMLVCCEEALASCQLASLRIDGAPEDLGTALAMASMAKSKVGRGARFVAQEAVQLHGGMGVCEELPVAAMFRKLTAFGQQMGSTAWHGETFGRAMLACGAWRASQTLLDTQEGAA